MTMSSRAVTLDLCLGKHTAFLGRADVIEGICHRVFIVPEEVSGSLQGSIKYKRTNILNGRPGRKEVDGKLEEEGGDELRTVPQQCRDARLTGLPQASREGSFPPLEREACSVKHLTETMK